MRWKIGDGSRGYGNYININGPQELDQKRQVWRDLTDLVSTIDGEPICIMGDFNSIASKGERLNCIYGRKDSKDFGRFIKANDLKEVLLGNYNYTWFGPQGKCSKLDRALVNPVWHITGHWQMRGMGRKNSDHIAICLFMNSFN